MNVAQGSTLKAQRSTGGLGLVLCALCLVLNSCAARRIALPTDAGAPFPDFATVHTQIAKACSGVRTLTAELSLSGRAGEQTIRGRVVAGFERPASMRLEGVAPFGQPVFILAARDDTAILLLPRDGRVLRGSRAEDILGAMTGIALGPPDLQAVLTGCVVSGPMPVAGRLHQNGWVSIDIGEGATLFLEREGDMWQVRGARRSGWEIEYSQWQGAFPSSVRIQSTGGGASVDLTAGISQLETNVDIPPAAFTVNVPPDARSITLTELRNSGPLRGTE